MMVRGVPCMNEATPGWYLEWEKGGIMDRVRT